jgi:hypothetical protein
MEVALSRSMRRCPDAAADAAVAVATGRARANLLGVAKGTEQAPATKDPVPQVPGAPPQPSIDNGGDGGGGMVIASHEVLFASPVETRCDACNRPLADRGDADEGFDVPGEGVYLWARGEEVRFERAPLCASCASAIGMTALARWEIEEEEG